MAVMKKMLLKLLNHLTNLINQLPDESIRMKERKSPYQKGLNVKVKYSVRPERTRNNPKERKRKGDVHSDEKIFNHERK
jgi:hypothetical protein